MRKKLKGFTLIEMIIVIAIFSVIMFAVVQLLTPVSNFFVRSSNYEDTTACLDNMKRAVEGNLKYANRMRVYSGYTPYTYDAATNTLTPSTQLQDHVEQFYADFFENRKCIDALGRIYVMVFDNEETVTWDANNVTNAYDTLSDYAQNRMNRGMISMITFDMEMENASGIGPYHTWADVQATMQATPWYVNQSLYGNYDYQFKLGVEDPDLHVGGGGFQPSNFTMLISQDEIRKNPDGGLVRTLFDNTMQDHAAYGSTICSFSMKNVMDAATNYTTPKMDFKILCNNETALGMGLNPDPYTVEHPNGMPCVSLLDENTAADPFNGFYFIYTLPETTYDFTTFYDARNPI